MLASSCAEDIEPSIPQHNPQEPIVNADDVVAAKAGVLVSDAVLNLENYKESNQIPVLQLDKAEGLPEGATVSFKLELSDTEDFERSQTIDLEAGTSSDETPVTYYASADAWNAAQVYLLGKSPKEKTLYYRIPGYINIDGSDYRIDSVDSYMAEGSIKETCFDMGFVIEDHYYLLSNATTWDLASPEALAPFEFEHSKYDVYDDPVFVIRFKVTADQLDDYWKIAPQSAVDANNWDLVIGTETDGDTALYGHLVSEGAQAGKLTQAGNYKMTINMESMTYEIEYLAQPDLLYTPGGANGWNQVASSYMQLKEGEYYYGIFPVNEQGFKICAEPNWNNDTTYGAELEAAANSGTFVIGEAGKNIMPETLGLNWITAKYDPIGYYLTTYELIPITTVGLIGGFAASGWGNDVIMSSDDEGKTWTAEAEFKAGDEYKFRFNSDWGYNLGGNADQLTFDGSNLTAPEEGTYVITLNLGSGYPSCSLAKK